MMDTNLQKLAQVLIRYSLDVQPGDVLRIGCGPVAMPLLYEAFREAVRAGAHVVTRVSDPSFEEFLLREGSDAQLKWTTPLVRTEIETIGKWLDIMCDTNTQQFTSIDPARISMRHSVHLEEQNLFNQLAAAGQIQSCLTLYPTEAYAQEAGMSLREYTDFVYNACLLNEPDPAAAWRQMYETQQKLVAFLGSRKHIRIVAPGTELEYQCGGRRWINCAGKQNLPDGEVFTSPIENSVNGHVQFSYHSIHNGTVVNDVALTFEAGKVIKSSASQGHAFLEGMLEMDEGARRVGEVAFGTNYGIQRATGHALFDEKMGGTMHLALGWAYPETGGTNESTLHWDLVCDLKQGEVYADGELCYKHGQFLI
jgi:aminopeptidase